MANHEVKAPIPGTFYRRPSPEQPAFVEVGDAVKAETTVCLVEVMKNFVEVKAQADGAVVEILVDNEDAVRAGDVLMRIKP